MTSACSRTSQRVGIRLMRIYTIGHSNHTWESFAPLLKRYGIRLLVDVRSSPVSRWAPFASEHTLPNLLEGVDGRYLHLGSSLGGKPADSSYYDTQGKVDYRKLRSAYAFQEGIEELMRLARREEMAIMCAEEDPAKCHRSLLLGPALDEYGVDLAHIRADGSLQSGEAIADTKAYKRQLQGVLALEDTSE